jgi:error-prone DNA polymerase
MSARLIKVSGIMQREGIVTHVIARHIVDMSHLLDGLDEATGFEPAQAYGDEVNHTSRSDLRGDDAVRFLKNEQTKQQSRVTQRHPRDQAKTLFPSRDFH